VAALALHDYLERSAARDRNAIVIIDPNRHQQATYGDLDELSSRLRDRLRQMGVRAGDRIGIYLPKSIDSVAAIFGVLKAGAAYVPVDPLAPAARNAFIFADCEVRAVIVEQPHAEALQSELARLGATPLLLPLEPLTGASSLAARLACADAEEGAAPAAASARPEPDDLAYVLYTSGSTGKPKGVMLSHLNATSFVDWCSAVLTPNKRDRFSSHAPFHFDLSIHDIYVPLKHGAATVLIGEELGKNPAAMASVIAEHRLTVWYSTPSVLTLLVEHGKLDSRGDYALRLVLFAGEVFPVKHLRRLKDLLPRPRYLNLYGPTETNVCTYHEIPALIEKGRVHPYPIGKACSHVKSRVIDEAGQDVPRGQEGELIISGAPVMRGYWNLRDRTATAFQVDATGRWYRTGDIVVEGADGVYTYRGRRDRMVKRRGYRIELGEIEAALYRHPSIREAAAVALAKEDGLAISAFYASRDGAPLSLIELKRFCSENLPAYMIPDRFSHQNVLPKTSTDKIDYQRLKEVE
jgi:amino acid adenylation domain-containing protein